MALKLVLEPIFEADQYRSSYAYRPGRRAQDAVAEIVHAINNGYQWVIEGDLEACFDSIRTGWSSSGSAAESPTAASSG